MNPLNLFAELKRRNVFRAGALYAASAWLLVRVTRQSNGVLIPKCSTISFVA